MISELSTTILFKCPCCGERVKGKADIFRFSGGSDYLLSCPEGGPSLLARLRDDGRVKVTVPCIICEGQHTFHLPKSVFFTEEIFVLSCAASDIDICVLGAEDKAENEYEQIDADISELIYEDAMDCLIDSNPYKMEIIKRLNQMAEERRIVCECGCDDLEFRLTDESVDIRCSRCSALLSIPAVDEPDYYDVLGTDEYVLKKSTGCRVIRDR